MGGGPREQAQQELGTLENPRSWVASTFSGSGCRGRRRHEVSSVRGNVTRPQLMGGGQEGELVAGQPHHTGAPGHLGGEPIACVWGCRGSRKNTKF